MSKGTLVLASASPRRVALLKQVGLPFEQIVSPAPEPAPEGEAVEHAIHSARTKAEAVSENLPRDRGTFVVGADTVVWLEDLESDYAHLPLRTFRWVEVIGRSPLYKNRCHWYMKADADSYAVTK